MIDVYAAFQYLTQNHIPIDPNSSNYDIHLDSVTIPNYKESTCDDSLYPLYILLTEGIFQLIILI